MSNDSDSIVLFTADRPREPRTLTRAEFKSIAATFADELAAEVKRLQDTGRFSPEAVASFVRSHRLGARVLMTEIGS